MGLIFWVMFPYIQFRLNLLITRNWQEIEIENVGSLRVSVSWVFTEKEGVIYFTDRELSESDTLEDVTLYMFSLWPNTETWEGRSSDDVSNSFFESIRRIDLIRRDGSYGSGHGKALYEVDGEEVEMMFVFIIAGNIWVGRHPSQRAVLNFVIWDESVSETTVRRIMRSYRQEPRVPHEGPT